MAFTKEEKRDLRAKRKRERQADNALRGVKPQPVGRPRKHQTWNSVAGSWFPTAWPADHIAIVCAERRATLPYDSPDYPVWAALHVTPAPGDRGVISRFRQRIGPYTQQDATEIRQFENRAAAHAWLTASSVCERSGSAAQNTAAPFVFRKSRLQAVADRRARRRSAAAFDRRSSFTDAEAGRVLDWST